MITKQTILATCYAVNPYKGSEDAMGWNFVYQIARFRKVFVITRENNKSHIENYMKENPDPVYQNMNFLYFDLPYWMRFWKNGSRGALLYYYLWQRGIVLFIKKQKLNLDTQFFMEIKKTFGLGTCRTSSSYSQAIPKRLFSEIFT